MDLSSVSLSPIEPEAIAGLLAEADHADQNATAMRAAETDETGPTPLPMVTLTTPFLRRLLADLAHKGAEAKDANDRLRIRAQRDQAVAPMIAGRDEELERHRADSVAIRAQATEEIRKVTADAEWHQGNQARRIEGLEGNVRSLETSLSMRDRNLAKLLLEINEAGERAAAAKTFSEHLLEVAALRISGLERSLADATGLLDEREAAVARLREQLAAANERAVALDHKLDEAKAKGHA